MKPIRVVILLILLCCSQWSNAQMAWTSNYELAQAIAIERDQLILVDFWAIWCGPCRTMDRDLWSLPEMKELAKNFVPLKVDVDTDRSMAIKYNAKSIPMVLLMTASGEVIWQQIGYGNADQYIRILEQIPASLNGLNRVITAPDVTDYEIAKAYQGVGSLLSNSLGSDFLALSSRYFNKVAKSDDPQVATMAELNKILNDAYAGRYKKVFKQLEKGDFPESDEVKEMVHFIEAFCYKCQGDEKKFAASREQISNEAYLTELSQMKN